MLIKLRAECLIDVDRFLNIIPKTSLMSYKVTKIKMPDKNNNLVLVPDVDCELEIEDWTIPDLIDLMSHIPDSHVMQETVAPIEEYTGYRTYNSPDSHKKRHVLLHKMLDELAADYLSHTKNLLQNTTIFDLIDWSYQQTLNPTDYD